MRWVERGDDYNSYPAILWEGPEWAEFPEHAKYGEVFRRGSETWYKSPRRGWVKVLGEPLVVEHSENAVVEMTSPIPG